jgi:RNA polymerase sigma-70 factor (ECF subfamily)
MIEPLLDSGLSLALSLTANRADAEDSLQSASLKAYRGIDRLQGDDAKPWFLRIVRNEALTLLRRRAHRQSRELSLDEEIANARQAVEATPDKQLLTKEFRATLNRAIAALSVALRETLLLRELEGLSYQEIANVTEVPIGTVMSRLSRARRALAAVLEIEPKQVAQP